MLSCSKDSIEEEKVQDCKMEEVDDGCEVVFLQGNTGWVKILKQGDLADPLFLYPAGNKAEPYGTVTVTLNNGNPVLKINDVILDDYLVRVSQVSDGSNSTCQSGKDVESLDSGSESPSTIRLLNKYEFPFYLQLEANVCF